MFSQRQSVTLAVLKMCSGTLSVMGSSLIAYNAIQKLRLGISASYHRILLGMSLVDIFFSFFAGTIVTLLVPSESGGWGCLGNYSTCQFQAFFVQMSSTTIMYNASLSIYFYMEIKNVAKRRSSMNSSQSRRFSISSLRNSNGIPPIYEAFLHIVPWAIGLGTGTYGLAKQFYGSVFAPEVGCWISQYPIDCFLEDGPECRGGIQSPEQLKRVLAVFGLWILSASLILVFLVNVAIFVTVFLQVRKLKKYGDHSNAQASQKIRTVAFQNVLYVVVMINTVLWVLLTDVAIYVEAALPTNFLFPLHVLYVLTFPMQGFWNLLVYIRRRFFYLRSHNSNASFFQVFREAALPNLKSTSRLSSGARSVRQRSFEGVPMGLGSSLRNATRIDGEPHKDGQQHELGIDSGTPLAEEGEETSCVVVVEEQASEEKSKCQSSCESVGE